MSQMCKILTLFALIAPLALRVQAFNGGPSAQPELELGPAPVDQTENDDVLYYAPSPYGDDMSPESQYPLDDMAAESNYQYPSSPPPYAPEIEEDYPYVDGEYQTPSSAPYVDVLAPEVEDFYDSAFEAPSPTEIELQHSGVSKQPSGSSVVASPPAFDYRAEDDAGYFSDEDENEEGYGEGKKGGAIGLVMGAVCLVGLGGLVYKRRKNQKRKHSAYVQLAKSGEV